ncbi:MAG: LiaI-LiaF-like domain-containing protein [Ignavibacteriaceae bacterium]
MKIRNLFWGLFFATLGVLILLANLGSLNFDMTYIWKFWPIIFILLGLSYFTTNTVVKGFLSAISAIIIAVALFAFFNSIFWFVRGNDFLDNHNDYSFTSDSDSSNYSTDYNSNISKADFHFDAGAGTFIIKDTTNQLISAHITGHRNLYRLNKEISNGDAIVKFRMEKRTFTFFDEKNGHNFADIRLNPNPVWNLYLNGGAADMSFDLTPFKTSNIDVKMGAAKIKIRLGNKSEMTTLNLNAGVSSIEILVPESSGCRINNKSALSDNEFKGFNKVGNNEYETDNFDQAKDKIYLHLNAGVSSIHVNRYTGSGW